jgi:multiple antibiotic resistance protein
VSLQEIVLFSTTLLAVVKPIASSVLFVSVAGEFDAGIRRRMANRTAMAILIILIVCAWLGNSILGLMGLTPPMLQAAGGFILLNYGLSPQLRSGTTRP